MRQARRKALILAALLGGVALAIGSSVFDQDGAEQAAAPTSRADSAFIRLLADPVEGFAPVDSERVLDFPDDHGAHRQQRTEVWVLSGVLDDATAGLWAVQLTIFRVGLSAEPVTRQSDWAVNEMYAGIFAISNVESGGTDVADRASRAAAGLAGMRADPLRIWIEDWRLDYTDASPNALLVDVQAATMSAVMNLELSGRLPPVSNSGPERALSAGDLPFTGYLQAGLDAVGAIRRGDKRVEVSGKFVLEHAWGELPPPVSPVANDRFTLFLDDGREVMLIRSHRVDGSGTPRTAGVVIGADGTPNVLPEGAVELTPERYWDDKLHGARYPTHWSLDIRGTDVELRLVPEGVDHGGAAWRPFWMAPVRLVDADSTTAGTGIVVLNGYGSAGRN